MSTEIYKKLNKNKESEWPNKYIIQVIKPKEKATWRHQNGVMILFLMFNISTGPTIWRTMITAMFSICRYTKLSDHDSTHNVTYTILHNKWLTNITLYQVSK